MTTKDVLIITPKTKVLQLIESYPKLEDVLIAYVPAFKKLKNPATIGNVTVEELINALRKEVGQELFTAVSFEAYNSSKPDWFDKSKIESELNITEMLAAGEQPVNQVVADLKSLPENSIYKIISPFVPAPLIDKAISLEFEHWIDEHGNGSFFIYFIKSSS